MCTNSFEPERPEPDPDEVETFIQEIGVNEPYRPAMTKLVTAKQWFRERLVKSGRFTFLQRDHWRVLEVLIESVNLSHWRATDGEMFAHLGTRAIEEIAKLGFKNCRRNTDALEKFGLIQAAFRVLYPPHMTAGWLLVFPDECDSKEWFKHFNQRGDAKRRRDALTNHPTLFPEPESPVTPEGVTGDSCKDGSWESRVTPPGVTGDCRPESRVTPQHNKERARAASTLSNSSSSTPQSAAAADLENSARNADHLAASRVLKDLHIGREKIRELLALPSSDYRIVRAAQIEASKSHVPNKAGLTISLVKHPERISDWALEETDRRIAAAASQPKAQPTAPPRDVRLTPEAIELLQRSKSFSTLKGAEHGHGH